MVTLARIKKGTDTSSNVKKRDILTLLSAPVRYVKQKIESAYKRLVKKGPRNAEKKVNR